MKKIAFLLCIVFWQHSTLGSWLWQPKNNSNSSLDSTVFEGPGYTQAELKKDIEARLVECFLTSLMIQDQKRSLKATTPRIVPHETPTEKSIVAICTLNTRAEQLKNMREKNQDEFRTILADKSLFEDKDAFERLVAGAYIATSTVVTFADMLRNENYQPIQMLNLENDTLD